jgi:hypothetical protein
MACHVGHSLNPDLKWKKMQDTPELLICVFPVNMPNYNSETIEVNKPQKEGLAVLMCMDSHYAVAEVSSRIGS